MEKIKAKLFSIPTIVIFLLAVTLTVFNKIIGVTFLVTVIFGLIFIPSLEIIKAKQSVRLDSSKEHLRKNGTLTLGGLTFIPAIILVCYLEGYQNPKIIACLLVTFSYMLIGLVDDCIVIKEANNKGLKARYKILFQSFFASIFMFWLIFYQQLHLLFLSFWGTVVIPDYLYFGIGVFFLVGFANASNITDGVDGLCSGTSIFIALGLLLVTQDSPSDLILYSLVGGCLGFLAFNWKTAIIFMGDTGSLALGTLFASYSLVTGNIIPLMVIGIVFVLDTLSVIIQTSYYKYTRIKRGKGVKIFIRSPYHHTLEAYGISESSIVAIACLITVLATLLCWLIL